MEFQCTEFLTLPRGGRKGFTLDRPLSSLKGRRGILLFKGQTACAKTGLIIERRVLYTELEKWDTKYRWKGNPGIYYYQNNALF